MKRIALFISIVLPNLLNAQYDVNGDFKINGNVGIGHIAPWDRLTVEPGYLTLSNNQNANRGIGGINFANRAISGASATSTLASIRVKTANAHYAGNMMFDIRSGGATYEAMRLRYDGNLGIGHNDPWEKLTIKPGYITLANNIPDVYTEVGGINFNNVAIAGSKSASDLARIRVETAGAHFGGELIFDVRSGGAPYEAMRIRANGNVGIGTNDVDSKLTVNGKIHCKEVLVDTNITPPDYVFEEDYNLRSLEYTESYIQTNKHLPEIPSAKEMEANGINVSEMNMLLLKKVEELTLHLIDQHKKLEVANKNIEILNKEMAVLKQK